MNRKSRNIYNLSLMQQEVKEFHTTAVTGKALSAMSKNSLISNFSFAFSKLLGGLSSSLAGETAITTITHNYEKL